MFIHTFCLYMGGVERVKIAIKMLSASVAVKGTT